MPAWQRHRPRVAWSVLLALVVLLQPLVGASADDCAALQQQVNDLQAAVNRQKSELQAALRALESAQRDMASDLDKISSVQRSLQDEPDKVRQQLDAKGLSDALKVLGPQLAFTLALALMEPALAFDTVYNALELAHNADTVAEVLELIREANEAAEVLDQMADDLGGIDELRDFAAQNGLTELTYLINQEAYLAALEKDFAGAYGRWLDAADAVVAYQAVLDNLRARLQAAADALYDCLARNSGEPCPSGNPNGGAGICH